MRDFLLSELKSACMSHTFTEEENRLLAFEVSRLCGLAKASRFEGLLGLLYFVDEEEWVTDGEDWHEKYGVAELDKNSFDQYLVALLELVTEGTEPAFIRELAEATMCTSGFTPVELIRYMIYLEGMINIQCGTSLNIFGKMLEAYLPLGARRI